MSPPRLYDTFLHTWNSATRAFIPSFALAGVISTRNAVWMERGNGGITNFLNGEAINPFRGIFGAQEWRSSQAGGSQL